MVWFGFRCAVITIACAQVQGQVVCTAPVTYGTGTSGWAGATPQISTGGRDPALGDPEFGVDASHVRAGAPVTLLLSFGSLANTSVLGVDLLVDPGQLLAALPGFTDTTGYDRYPLPLPVQSGLVGQHIFAQLFAADSAASEGVAASHGLDIVLCDTPRTVNLRRSGGLDASGWSAQDSSVTDMRPAHPSFQSPDGSHAYAGVGIVVDEVMTITRIAGVGAAVGEDYASMRCTIRVYAQYPDENALSDPGIIIRQVQGAQLSNPSPPTFGGQSPVGVPNRFLEFEFDPPIPIEPRVLLGAHLSPHGVFSWVPAQFLVSIVREDAGPDDLVWSETTVDLGTDYQSNDQWSPLWSSNSLLGSNPGTLAIDVFARVAPCADHAIRRLDLDPSPVTLCDGLQPMATALGLQQAFGQVLYAYWFDGAPRFTSYGFCSIAGTQSWLDADAATLSITTAVATETVPGEISYWWVVQGRAPSAQVVTSVTLLTQRACPFPW